MGNEEKTPVTLYRLFDANRDLLYVGVAVQPLQRLLGHKNTQTWWLDVALVTLDHYPDRIAALEAEAEAIESEGPRFNVYRPAVRLRETVSQPQLERGRAIRELRERANLSQSELGRAIGVSEKTIGRWERGLANPRARHRRLLVDAIGVPT